MNWFARKFRNGKIRLINIGSILKTSFFDVVDLFKEAKYQSLMPNVKAEKIEGYSQALRFALKDKSINNIAVSGPLGSGKSSFLKTFQRKNGGYNYFNISLITFEDEPLKSKCADKERADVNEGEFENDCEDLKSVSPIGEFDKRLVKQIFYQIDSSNIPLSRFKKIEPFIRSHLFLNTFVTTYLFLYVMWLIFPTKFIALFEFITSTNIPWLKLVIQFLPQLSFIIAISSLVFIMFKVIKFLKEFKLVNIGLRKGELNFSKDGSAFDEHLDEIVYFFEVNNFDTIIIEDLDRFNDKNIFTKIRELNVLINSSRKRKNKNSIKFVYAISDCIFTDKQRVKFFDLMIPIIPYINPTNAYDKMLSVFNDELLDKNVQKHVVLKKEFLSGVAPFIDDMRLLANIVNEFHIYKSNMNENLNRNKLLAMIVYKNFMPDDFVKLHNKTGDLADVFNNRDDFIVKLIKTKNESIKVLQDRLDKLDQRLKLDQNVSIKELRLIYLYELLKYKCTSGILIGTNKQITLGKLDDINNEEDFNEIVESEQLFSIHRSGYNFKFSDIEKDVNPNISYNQRKQNILNSTCDDIDDLKLEIQILNNELINIDELALNELIVMDDSDNILKSIESYPLLKFLISFDYIGDDYHSYISHFFAESISKTDNDFLINVNSNKYSGFNYSLDKVQEINLRLLKRSFKKPAIVNKDLLTHLLKNKDEYVSELKSFLDTMVNKRNDPYSFTNDIVKYLESIDDKDLLINLIELIAPRWRGFWKYLLNFDISYKVLDLVINYSSIETLTLLNKDNLLTQSINKNSKFEFISINDSEDRCALLLGGKLNENDHYLIGTAQEYRTDLLVKETLGIDYSNNPLVDRYVLVFKHLEVKFNDIRSIGRRIVLRSIIFNGNHYDLNFHNLMYYLNNITANTFDVYDIKYLFANYSTIKNNGLFQLNHYIDNNINEYVEMCSSNIPLNKLESSDSIVYLLNHKNLTVNNKFMFINTLKINDYDYTDATNISENREANIQYENYSIIGDIELNLFNPEERKNYIDDLIIIEDSQLWPDLFNVGLIKPNWLNLLIYFAEYSEVDDNLANYLNMEHIYTSLSEDHIEDYLDVYGEGGDIPEWVEENVNDNTCMNLSNSIILSKGISLTSLSELLKTMNTLSELDLILVSPDILVLIIKMDLLPLNEMNYEAIKRNEELAATLIINNVSEFLEHKESYIVNDAIQYEIIKFICRNFTKHNISDEIIDSLVNEFDYSHVSEKFLILICDMVSDLIYLRTFELSEALMIWLLDNTNLEKQVDIFINQECFLDSNKLRKYFSFLPKTNPLSKLAVARKKKIKFPIIMKGNTFCKILIRKGVISSAPSKISYIEIWNKTNTGTHTS
jgi:hypothetical protein